MAGFLSNEPPFRGCGLSSKLTFSLLLAAALARTISRSDAAPLTESPFVVVSNPPPVQMLVPGFTVRELPLHLNNINNLVYAPDGRLFALAYDGNVFELKDTDGDGLEDTASYFYKNDQNEIPSSIGMCWGPGGLYIASRGRVIRLRDKGDGTAELQTVASGWPPPTIAAGQSLDAVGVAVDPKGNIYFGLGSDAWSAPYRVNTNTGGSDYNLYRERGVIMKLSSDWKRREILASGVRFTVSLAFNSLGDLFCTDQEGATWLANGNPFDELLHIQTGRHYGFPPRHPLYLPGVIDEPSVFDYSPQHQSTCGLHFNDGVGGGADIVGPAWWRRDALIAGESRGKIFRTKLVKTPSGYVAQNNLIACLSMLTIDATPSPQGGLVVTCHSGAPDWGTGPEGKGKLFKISYTGKDAPQPLLSYAASPSETRVVFDRPLDLADLKNLANLSRITMGEYVTAGDRFESFVPGYQAVKDQRAHKRYDLPVLSAGITPDRRTVVLQTAPRTEAVAYAVTLPERERGSRACDPARHELPQYAAIDVLTDLTGVEAEWRATAGDGRWSGWLPHPDLLVARELTAPSAEHQRFFEMLQQPGSLRLRAQLGLGLMLRTVIQPGAKIDFEYPQETVTIVLKSEAPLDVKSDSNATVRIVGGREIRVTTVTNSDRWLPLDITLPTGPGDTKLEVSWHTAEDARPRALPLRRVFMPWARQKAAGPPEELARRIPEISGGNWGRGKIVFYGEQAACSKCHQVRGEGGKIGPDLSNLIYRDYESVLKDITQPSAAINPDHIAYNLELKNGEAVTGVVLEETPENLVLGQVSGVPLTIPKNTIVSRKASSLSLMPEGLLQPLGDQQRRDLMTFLLTQESDK
jgi:putative heme-binding domain-containing protein